MLSTVAGWLAGLVKLSGHACMAGVIVQFVPNSIHPPLSLAHSSRNQWPSVQDKHAYSIQINMSTHVQLHACITDNMSTQTHNVSTCIDMYMVST